MRALPARRIALGALCAALLTTTTGPTAFAADSLPGQDPAASLVARLPQTDAAPADLTPVADLVRAVLSAPDGQLPVAEARRLAAAAREAVDRAANDDPSSTLSTTSTSSTTVTVVSDSSTPLTPALPGTAAPATGVLLPTTEEDGTPAVNLGALREAMENLLNVLLPKADQASSTSETSASGTAESTEGTETADGTAATETSTAALPSTDELLARVRELLDALTGTAPQTATTLPAPAEPAAPATTPGVVPALTSLLLPNS
ncbi:hypothetical protein ACPCBF_01425 [Streptomyces pseudogriseolus]|uniref:hypothetical protein n=1 Tax=Streptomyces pseudogriseolus TaxID=36817 RepID=UPI003FA30F96